MSERAPSVYDSVEAGVYDRVADDTARPVPAPRPRTRDSSSSVPKTPTTPTPAYIPEEADDTYDSVPVPYDNVYVPPPETAPAAPHAYDFVVSEQHAVGLCYC